MSGSKKKNILFITFDDAVSPWAHKTAFNEPLQIPNLDRLAEKSTVFHAAYAQVPICAPSRASMMMTEMPSESGIVTNSTFSFDRLDPKKVWSFQLKENGYYCSSGGKIHHGYRPLKPHLQSVLYHDERKRFSDDMRLPDDIRGRAKPFGGFRKGLGTKDDVDDDFFYDKKVSDSAIAFLESYDRPEPFYREVGFYSPHVPWITPARFKRLYNTRNFKPPAEWAGYVDDNPYVTENIPEMVELRSEKYWQATVRNYFSAYSHGDYHLGRVLDALQRSGHAENTIVVVTSDHGFHLGNRNLLRKTTLWEQSLRVPLIIFDPDNPVGRDIHEPVALIDIGPTMLDLVGIDGGVRKHARSLRPAIRGEPAPERVIPSFYSDNVTIRKGDYRIIRYGDGSMQLFDVVHDVWQLRDLGTGHEAFPAMHRALLECMHACGFDPSRASEHSTASQSGPADE